MKIAITGHTSGLGKFLHQQLSNSHSCIGFSRTNGFDLKADFDQIIKQIYRCDIFVNNSFAMGEQLNFLKEVQNIPQVVIGSIAARNPDINMPYYSQKKREIEEYFLKHYTHTHNKSLYIQLTGKSYQDYQLILRSINFWLENPQLNFIGYRTK